MKTTPATPNVSAPQPEPPHGSKWDLYAVYALMALIGLALLAAVYSFIQM